MRWIGGSHVPVAVVGGGQAGLSMSYCLRERGIDHIVIEAGRLGREWRERRWDTFCLVTPNWQCKLPGFPYTGPDRDGFMDRAQIVRYLEDYAASFDPPLVEGVSVTRLSRLPHDVFELCTTAGVVAADQVVVATGPYHKPAVPKMADRLPSAVTQLHSSQYRGPSQLPDGGVLVVGTGQSGCQIAEDLHLAGRQVHLAVGGAPRIARFYRGRDCVAWLDEMGHYAKGIDTFTDADAVRLRANHYVSGRGGGRDIDLRAFARDGMRLYGRLIGIDGMRLAFAGDLKANLDSADLVADNIKDAIDAYIAAHYIPVPTEARYTPVWEPGDQHHRLNLDAAAISTVIWSTGFARDDHWIEVPVFDDRGYPEHRRGVTGSPGLYFVGQVWQSTWGSGRFEGVGRDARFLAEQIDASRRFAGKRGMLANAQAMWFSRAPGRRSAVGGGAAHGNGFHSTLTGLHQ